MAFIHRSRTWCRAFCQSERVTRTRNPTLDRFGIIRFDRAPQLTERLAHGRQRRAERLAIRREDVAPELGIALRNPREVAKAGAREIPRAFGRTGECGCKRKRTMRHWD